MEIIKQYIITRYNEQMETLDERINKRKKGKRLRSAINQTAVKKVKDQHLRHSPPQKKARITISYHWKEAQLYVI
jgi:hypothetical protein